MKKYLLALIFLGISVTYSACGIKDEPYDLSQVSEGASGDVSCADEVYLTEDCIDYVATEGSSEGSSATKNFDDENDADETSDNNEDSLDDEDEIESD